MADIKNKAERRVMRHARVRKRIAGTEAQPRLVVFRSSKHLYAQVVNDDANVTITGASTLSPEIKETIAGKTRSEQATELGKLISKKMKDKSIEKVVFDRNGYPYHGIVKLIAEAVRAEKLLN
ncbi:MAG: 50S ribosomal protein L18 [Candidatus Cloacimonadota bacterium]|nr:MAG: 50S ribosomal protein L18 [Candidatus Cloacimonadota bacterium]